MISAVNIPIFCVYMGLVIYVGRKVGIQYVKQPMNYYLAGYMIVFTDRFVDALLQ